MDDIVRVFMSWQFLLVGVAVWMIFELFNKVINPYLWKVNKLRKVLKFLEGIKLVFPPLLGFGIGWIPSIPRPEALNDASQFTVALLYSVAGLCSQWIVKGVRKALEARGIDTDLDDPPRQQRG